jgi:hypothetical protein
MPPGERVHFEQLAAFALSRLLIECQFITTSFRTAVRASGSSNGHLARPI